MISFRSYLRADWQAVLEICLLAFTPIHGSFERTLGTELFELVYPDWKASQRKVWAQQFAIQSGVTFSSRLLITLLLCMGTAYNQTLPPIQHIQAELATPIKLAKAREGDALKATTLIQVQLANGTSIPAGSTILGRIAKLDANAATLVFDQVSVDRKLIPIALTLSGLAYMGPTGNQMTTSDKSSTMESPSGGSLPNDHPLNGGGYSVIEAGANAVNGVNHEALAEVNGKPATPAAGRGADVPGHAGSVINIPGLKLTVEDDAPFYSKLDFSMKEPKLNKGVQLMFSVR